MKKINVLFLSYHGGAGGVSVLIYNIAKVLKNSDKVNLEICYASFKGIYGKEVEKMGIKVFDLKMKNGYDLFNALRIFRILKNNDFDIIHLHYFTPLLRILVYLFSNKITVITEHGSIKSELLGKRWIIMKYIQKILKNTCDAYTAVSIDSKNDLIINGLSKPENTYMIYNGIDTELFKPDYSKNEELRQKFSISNDTIVIGTVRGLIPKMGIDHLIYASEKIISRNKNVKFLIVGDGILRNELEQLCKELNVFEHFIFLGDRKDIPELLNIFDIFVMPSVWETFGIAAIEAMAVEKPVIGYAVGGLAEVIKNNESGVLIKERNFNELATEIEKLVNNEKIRIELGKKARQFVLNNFSINKTVDNFVNLYYSVLKK